MTVTLVLAATAIVVATLAAVARWRSFWTVALGVIAIGSTFLMLAVCELFFTNATSSTIIRLGPATMLCALVAYGFGCAYLLRRKHRLVAVTAASCAVITAAVGIDAFVIEPRQLEVTHTVIAAETAPRPIRVALLADIQFDDFGEYELDALRATMAEKPDVILFAGDYVQARQPIRSEQSERFRSALAEVGLRAPMGIFAVQGHSEDSAWPELFEEIEAETRPGLHTLTDGVSLTLLDLANSEDSKQQIRRSGGLHLVLGHSPDYALGAVDADVRFAGHTHGGQVAIPWFGPPVTLSEVPRSWASGLTELTGARFLYVSRGIGMERGSAPRIRFLTRPELAIIDIVPAR